MSAAAILIISRDGETLKSCPIEGEMMLGRGEGCVIRLEDRAISRQHAVFRPSSEGIQVEKKSEFAPLKVNGTDCTSAILREGDVISIGPYLMALSFKKSQEQQEAQRLEEADRVLDVEPALQREVQEVPTPVDEVAAPQGDEIPPFEVPLEGEPKELSGEIPLENVEEDGATKVAAPEKVQVKLIIPKGAANVTELLFGSDERSEISIGRGKACDVILKDKKSSRKNTIIRREGAQFIIKDLGSSNGTYVNHERIEEKELSGDDQIRIGDVEFLFKILSRDYVNGEKDFLPVQDTLEQDFEPPEAAQGMPDFNIALPVDQPQLEVSSSPPPQVSPELQAFNPGPGFANIAGIGPAVQEKPKSLIGKGLAKLNAMPPLRRTIWLIIIIGAIAFLLFDDETIPLKKTKVRTSTVTVSPSATPRASGLPHEQQVAFESLSSEQKKFVEATHHLAFEYFKNQEFDKALFELGKVFALVSDYKDAKDIERYAKEGKRRLEVKEEEQRRKAEEIRMKAKIEELENQAREKMAKKNYDQAREIFPQIHLLDPENTMVQKWSEEIEQAEQEQRIAQQRNDARKERNKDAWKAFHEGARAKKKGRFHAALAILSKIKEFEATDPLLEKRTQQLVVRCYAAIKALRDPLLVQGKEFETAGEFAKAYEAFRKAAHVDPGNVDALAGMDRARGVLHEQAKNLYTEGVLAESYSDFTTAKKKFREIVETTPKDDLYYQRAERKQARYFKVDEGGQTP